MDVESEPVSLETNPESSSDEIPVKQDNEHSIEDQNQSRKRPLRDISTGFTKAVIICSSSELTKSEANTYRPNNIVIELLKKNPMRYGKFTFKKFTSEGEIREGLSLRFTILKNKKFWFASADQYGKLNFRDMEEWSGRNLRRWLPGSSAMYIILENSQTDNENESRSSSDLGKDAPYSGISCTTVRAGTSTTTPVSWHDNNSQRALLDFLSSSEKSKLCNTQKMKMFAINAGQQDSRPQNESSKSPARLDLRTLALHTKNERIDLESRLVLRRQHSFSSKETSTHEASFSPKRRRFHMSQSVPCFARLTGSNKPFICDKKLENLDKKLEHHILENKRGKDDVAQSSHETMNTVSRTLYENSPEKHTKLISKKPFIPKDSNLGPRASSNESLESIGEKKESTHSSSRESPQRITNYSDASRIPRFFQPYYMVPDPRTVLGHRPPSEEQKETEEKVSSGHGVSCADRVSPIQAIYVPSTGFFPWGQINQGSAAHLPDKGPGQVAFVPFEVLPYSASGKLFPGVTSTNIDRNHEASRQEVPDLSKIDQRSLNETHSHEVKEEKQIPEKKTNGPLIENPEVSMETSPFELNDAKKIKDKDLVQKFLEMPSRIDESRIKEGKDLKYDCEMFPSSGPCKGGQSFVVVLNHPLEEDFDQATFRAKFNDHTSLVKLTRVDRSTLKGKAVPESSESGHVTVRVEADGHLIGCTSFIYEDGFVDGLRKVMFSGENGEMMLRFMTASENERHELQAELIDWLELVVYLSAQRGSTSTIDKIFSSRYGVAVKAQCSTRPIQPHQLALTKNRRAELCQHPKNIHIRKDSEIKEPNKVVSPDQSAANNDFGQEMSSSSSPSVSIDSAHAQDRDESCDKDTKDKNGNASPGYEDKADNLMLLSSIASRMGLDAQDGSKNSFLNSSPSGQISNGAMSAATNTSREEDCATSGQERGCPRSGFLKKVFVLPANSLYLPSQSELCKLRGSRSSYCKVFFNAEMNETDVYEQIRMAFDDLVGFSFRLAVVDQTGKLVFYDGFWTGKVIRRKLRGNSVLYVVPVVEKTIQIDCKSAV